MRRWAAYKSPLVPLLPACVLLMLRSLLPGMRAMGPVPLALLRPTVSVAMTLRAGRYYAAPPGPSGDPKPSLMARVRAELAHYWHGTKLFCHETRVSTRLIGKLVRGGSLMRRERLQLARTQADMIRLVPFSVFIIVPFMEFLLPVAIKLFPNMLPSTFEDDSQRQMKRSKAETARLESAKLIHDMMEAMATDPTLKPTIVKDGVVARHLQSLFSEYRVSGQSISTDVFVASAKRIEEESTLSIYSLSAYELRALCKYMGLSTFGTETVLRYQLMRRLRQLKKDDAMIDAEGIDSLTEAELVAACQMRGIQTLDRPGEKLRAELQQWLDLSLHHAVSPLVLIVTRALIMATRAKRAADLKQVGDGPVEKEEQLAKVVARKVHQAAEEPQQSSASSQS